MPQMTLSLYVQASSLAAGQSAFITLGTLWDFGLFTTGSGLVRSNTIFVVQYFRILYRIEFTETRKTRKTRKLVRPVFQAKIGKKEH